MESAPRSSNTSTILQLILGLITLGLSFVTALALVIVAVAGAQAQLGTTKTVYYAAWLCLAFGLSAIPSIFFSIRRLSRAVETSQLRDRGFMAASLSLLILIPVALLTTLPAFNPPSSVFMVFANILFVALPAWWIVELGRRKLPRITRQKLWGLFNFGAFVSVPFIILIEVILFIIGTGVLVAFLKRIPEYATLLNSLQNLMLMNMDSLPLIVDQFKPLLQNPGVIATLFVAIALVVPLIEELLKPLALWLFVKRRWSPAEGLIAGMVSGAAFSIVESLFAMTTVAGESWLALAGARMGTTLLHITTAGLSGWALTATWQDGKLRRAILTYLFVVFIHGLWNASAITVAFSQMNDLLPVTSTPVLASIAIAIMGLLILTLISLLFMLNRNLRRQTPAPLPPPVLPPLPQGVPE